jgi:tetratricopeptide (TPR) repeat protein
LSEELLNLLARVPGLKVAARTSSYAFKGKNEDLRTIGATLGVDQVLEGSVRRSGNRVRVTAQLVKVEDGFHIWSETYDREITELFSIQDDIASAITAALQVRLGVTMPKPATPTQNMESYALYLEARSLRLAGKNSEAIATLEKAISLDPDFAEAHMLAAQIFFDAPLPGFGEDMRYKLSEQHAVTARTLAPESVVAGALARVISVSRARRSTGEPMWDEYQDALRTAYTAESGDSQMRSQMRNWASWNYLTLGYFQRALSLADETIALDPLFMNAQMARLLALTGLGRSEEAQQVSELLMRNTGDYRGLNFRALISLANGDAAAAELLIEEFVDHRWGETDIIRAYLDSIIDPKTRDAAFQSNQWSMFMGATVGQVMYVLRDERLFTRLLSGKEFMPLAWAMPLRSSWFLNHPRFRAVAERRHAPYWQKHELPDFCNGNFDSWICELPVSVGNE